MNELTVAALVKNLETLTDFVDEQLEAVSCPLKAKMQINIAIDELFGNIANYAYGPDIGDVTIRVEIIKEPLSAVITFIDSGIRFDPMSAADPDTSLSADERTIGGLGIFIVKKSMDEVTYCHENGRNILSIRKNLME